MISILIFSIILLLYINNKKVYSLFLFLILQTNFLAFSGANFDIGNISLQNNDLCLVLIILFIFYDIFFRRVRYKINYKYIKPINLFLFFIIISVIADIAFNNTPIGNVFRTTRQWFFLLVLFPLSTLSTKEVEKFLKIIFILTTFQAVVYILQVIFNYPIYFGTEETRILTKYKSEGERFRNVPPFLILFLSSIIVNNEFRKRFISFILLNTVVILSATRSLLIGIYMPFFVNMILLSKKIKYKFSYIIIIVVLIFSVQLSTTFSERFNGGIDEISLLFNKGIGNFETSGNFSFRINHFLERYNYIVQNPYNIVFGLGFVTESDFSKTLFSVGLSHDDGQVIQLDSGDISWSVFILRYGIVGTVLFLVSYFILMKYFFLNRNKYYNNLAFYYMFVAIFLSFTSNILASAGFWFFPFLFYNLSERENNWRNP